MRVTRLPVQARAKNQQHCRIIHRQGDDDYTLDRRRCRLFKRCRRRGESTISGESTWTPIRSDSRTGRERRLPTKPLVDLFVRPTDAVPPRGRSSLSGARQAEVQFEPLIHRIELVGRNPAEHAPDAPFVDGAKLVDERE